jgi:L-aspartate oxidase
LPIKNSNRRSASPNLVIGGGIAGFSLALRLAEDRQVLMVLKGGLEQSASQWAQGGIAAVMDEGDQIAAHCEDTMQAGAGLCHAPVVEKVISRGPQAIQWLLEQGVEFSKDSNKQRSSSNHSLHLTREGGHSARRVVHASDQTGAEIMAALIAKAQSHPNISIACNQFVIDLIVSDKFQPDFAGNHCRGAYVFDREQNEIYLVQADRTFLCTGGQGRVYLYTSNPDGATGDGVALAWRAGCRIANLEFMQFHPTCLYHSRIKNFLISEALRGEGAVLRTLSGRAFMGDYHPQADLAPRDIVARAIDMELKKSGDTYVLLDASDLKKELLLNQFPNIYQRCFELGLDISKEPIPVIPAAHYSCGGVVVDENAQTNVRGLYALGEVACSGLHGANRLASNSLLEAVVYSEIVCEHVRHNAASPGEVHLPPWTSGDAIPADGLGILLTAWDEIRRIMWNYVGIVRSNARLQLAYDRLLQLSREIDRYYWKYEITERLVEVRNLVQVSLLIVRCAMARKESRGIHFNIDHADSDQRFGCRDTIIW